MPSNGVSSTFGFIAPYSFDQIFGANGFTLEAVFQQSKRTTGEIIIMCDYGQGGIGINIRTSSPYDLYFEYYLGGYKYIYSNQEISLDTLYSVSVVNDIPKDQLSIYINGTSAIETTSINATGPQDNSKWGIGNNVGGTTINNAGM
jgi:hypothetical protein